jgi:hypothetical protein
MKLEKLTPPRIRELKTAALGCVLDVGLDRHTAGERLNWCSQESTP